MPPACGRPSATWRAPPPASPSHTNVRGPSATAGWLAHCLLGMLNCMLEMILALARLFRAQGYELYMVGGTVRDLLLRREASTDVDLTTNARPDTIKRLAAATHPLAVVTVGEQFGTVRLHYRRQNAAPVAEQTIGLAPV